MRFRSKRRNRRPGSWLLAVAMICWTTSDLATAAESIQVEARGGVRSVEIAVAAPFSGPLSRLGRDIARGAQMAVDEANASGLHINDLAIRLTLREYDDQADPRAGARIGATIGVSEAIAVIGHLNSGVSIAATGFYHRARIAQVSPASTNPRLPAAVSDATGREKDPAQAALGTTGPAARTAAGGAAGGA